MDRDIDVEAQGGPYKDDPEFDRLSDTLADEVFDITASNGRLWAMLKNSKLEEAFELATDNRHKFRQLKHDIERLQAWDAPQPAQRFTQHKITREFSSAFAEFQRFQKALAERERGAIKDAQDAIRGDPKPKGSRPRAASAQKTKGSNVGFSDQGSAYELEDQEQVQELLAEEQLRQDEVSYQQGLIEEREEEIRGIETGISELNEIFTNLSTVVSEQGTVLDNIENNIYSVAQNTRDGSNQLTKAARWQRRSSGRQLCFLLILVIIALVIILSVLAG